MKFILSTMNTGPDEPPSIHIETFQPEVQGIESEAELVQYVFRGHGSGDYIIHAPVGPDSLLRTLWEGEVQVENDRNLMFKASQNQLIEYTDLRVELPLTGELKRVSIPRDLQEEVRDFLHQEG